MPGPNDGVAQAEQSSAILSLLRKRGVRERTAFTYLAALRLFESQPDEPQLNQIAEAVNTTERTALGHLKALALLSLVKLTKRDDGWRITEVRLPNGRRLRPQSEQSSSAGQLPLLPIDSSSLVPAPRMVVEAGILVSTTCSGQAAVDKSNGFGCVFCKRAGQGWATSWNNPVYRTLQRFHDLYRERLKCCPNIQRGWASAEVKDLLATGHSEEEVETMLRRYFTEPRRTRNGYTVQDFCRSYNRLQETRVKSSRGHTASAKAAASDFGKGW